METEMEPLQELVSDIVPAETETRHGAHDLLLTEIAAQSATGTEGGKSRRIKRRVAAAIAAVVAVPATFAIASSLNGDVVDNFGGFLQGETSGRELGRPVEAGDNPPKWFNGEGYTDQLVIASSGPHRLYMARSRDGNVAFSLDGEGGISSGGGANPFVNQFQGNSVVPLLPGPLDENDRLLYAGIVAPDVATVELRFDSGPPEVVAPEAAGFIFEADLGQVERGNVLIVDRRPVDVVALDDDGIVLQSVPAQCEAGMPALALRSDNPDLVGRDRQALNGDLDLPAGTSEYFDDCDRK